MKEDIKKYWNERASISDDKSATTNDVWLRDLEVRTMIKALEQIHIPPEGTVLDVGCGDGYSTIEIAKKFPNVGFDGIDFSESMIKVAHSRLEKEPHRNVTFQVGNVLDLDKTFETKFDVIMTDRCLINLNTPEMQDDALAKIASTMKKGAYYIGIENFQEGQAEMNNTRKSIGLSEIPVRWHNLFFSEEQFRETIKRDFNLIRIDNFSSAYYFATRVIYSKMCQMKNENPDYNHEIHQLAIDLPSFGDFSPIKCFLLRKR